MARRSPLTLLLLVVAVVAAVAAATVGATVSAAATAPPPPPAPEPPQPGPPERWDWRVCDELKPHVKHALEVDDICISPFPILTGQSWTLDIALHHRGRREIREATMTLRVYALKHLLVYSTTQDFCAASKKKEGAGAGALLPLPSSSSSPFVNMTARRHQSAGGPKAGAAATGRNGGDEEQSGCPLAAGEKTMLHFAGEWTGWAPESDKYSLRVLVHSHERPHPTNELLCVDIDVVARKPPSSSVAAS